MTQNPKIKLVIVDDHTLFREGIKKILSLEEDIEIIGEAFDGEDVIHCSDGANQTSCCWM